MIPPAPDDRQPTLWAATATAPTPPAPPHSGTDTSRAAARAVRPLARGRRAAVLGELIRLTREQGGGTDDQVEQALGLMAQSVTPRRHELARLGLIERTAERRPTRAGGTGIVWRAVAGAETALRRGETR